MRVGAIVAAKPTIASVFRRAHSSCQRTPGLATQSGAACDPLRPGHPKSPGNGYECDQPVEVSRVKCSIQTPVMRGVGPLVCNLTSAEPLSQGHDEPLWPAHVGHAPDVRHLLMPPTSPEPSAASRVEVRDGDANMVETSYVRHEVLRDLLVSEPSLWRPVSLVSGAGRRISASLSDRGDPDVAYSIASSAPVARAEQSSATSGRTSCIMPRSGLITGRGRMPMESHALRRAVRRAGGSQRPRGPDQRRPDRSGRPDEHDQLVAAGVLRRYWLVLPVVGEPHVA